MQVKNHNFCVFHFILLVSFDCIQTIQFFCKNNFFWMLTTVERNDSQKKTAFMFRLWKVQKTENSESHVRNVGFGPKQEENMVWIGNIVRTNPPKIFAKMYPQRHLDMLTILKECSMSMQVLKSILNVQKRITWLAILRKSRTRKLRIIFFCSCYVG